MRPLATASLAALACALAQGAAAQSEPVVVPAEPVKEDAIASGSLDEINRNSVCEEGKELASIGCQGRAVQRHQSLTQ
jgi:hypothetical protein